MNSNNNTQIADLFHKSNGVLSTTDLYNAGFSLNNLHSFLKRGSINHIRQGFYKWTESEMTANDDFVTISRVIPHGIICLVSALSYYQVTTTIPREIHVALQRGATKPKRPSYPPVRYYYFASSTFQEGLDLIKNDGSQVRMYNLERTLCDCVRFRHKIGLEIVKEAMKNYIARSTKNIQQLERYAKQLHISTIVQQYLEILL